MKENDLIRLYGTLRATALISVPLAMYGLVSWLGGGAFESALFAVGTLFPLFDIFPGAHEIRHRMIQTRKQDGIWFRMI